MEQKAYDTIVNKILLPVALCVIIALLGYIASAMQSFEKTVAVLEISGDYLKTDLNELKEDMKISLDKNNRLVISLENRIIVIETILRKDKQ